MTGGPPPSASPSPVGEPAAVDFVKNQLPQIHNAFKNLPKHYHPTLKRFVFDPHAAAMPPDSQKPSPHTPGDGASTGRLPQGTPSQPSRNNARRIPARQVLPALCAMKFWSEILGDAMKQFTHQNPDVPKRVAKEPENGIRGAESWDDIYAKLQRAREKFDGGSSKFRMGAKQAYRHVINNNDVLRYGLEAIPNIEYLSPVKAGMELLLDAAKTAADVRTKVTLSFEEKDLTESFGKIELFLATFPGDENIRLASIDLVACTLKAIELAISYFMSHTLDRFRRVLPLIGDGSGFQEELINAINEIPMQCHRVKDCALESHIHGTKEAMELILSGIESIDVMGNVIYDMLCDVIEREGKLMTKLENLANMMLDFFNQGEEAKEAARVQEMRNWETMTQSLEKRFESLEIGVRLIGTPTPPPQQQQLPCHPPPQGQLPWGQPTQQPLAWQAQPSDLVQHQYAHPYPYQQQQQQQQQQSSWVAAPPPPSVYYYTPPPPPEPLLCISQLLATLGISSPDADDITSILESAESIGLKHRSRAKGIIVTDEFRAWATSPTSCALLILGDITRDTTEPSAALSLVSASLMQGLRSQPDRYIALVFFCRRHLESDDPHRGPGAMIRAFIAQLLQQLKQQQHGMDFLVDVPRSTTFTQRDLELGVNDPGLEWLRRWDTGMLCRLFDWLVRRVVPPHKTLVCVGDGVEAYESSGHVDDLGKVVGCLLGLTTTSNAAPTVKLMATSPEGTAILEGIFRRDGSAVIEIEALDSRGEEDDILEIEDEL